MNSVKATRRTSVTYFRRGPSATPLHGRRKIFASVALAIGVCTASAVEKMAISSPDAMNNHGIGSGYRARDKRNQPGTLGTRCRQMAQVVLYEAPLQMLCDSPTNYEKNRECFAFMAKTPTVWKNTVGLAGTPDTMFVAARETRDGAWYAGGITTAEARDCTLDTSFLGDGEWRMTEFSDASDSDKFPERWARHERKIRSGEKLRVRLAPGGGWTAKFSK